MIWELVGRLSRPLGAAIYSGPGQKRAIALTFDDGPSESTPALLELLSHHGILATFFQCGANVRRLPSIARAVEAAGHEIGNHSDSHTSMLFRSKEIMRSELARAQESILNATGRRPTLFRPPNGHLSLGLGDVARELGLTGVMWTVIAKDWTLPASEVARRLWKRASSGAIFCLHDGRGLAPNPDIRVTVEALRTLIPRLREQGFRFETVSQLVGA